MTTTETRPHERYGFAYYLCYALSVAKEIDDVELVTYKDVSSYKDSSKWIKAMKKERRSVDKNKTCVLVDKLKHQKLVGYK